MPEIISHVHVAFSLFVIDEFGDGWVVAAYRAFVVGWKFDSMEGHGQGIVGKKSACKEITFSNNVFDGFHCLKASDHTSHGPITPACLQVGTASFGGGSLNTHL